MYPHPVIPAKAGIHIRQPPGRAEGGISFLAALSSLLTHPNVIWVVADAFRRAHLDAYGNDYISMPALG